VEKSILVALKNSLSSKAVLDFLIFLPFCTDDLKVTLLNVFRKPSVSEELMGEDYSREEPSRLMNFLEKARDKLVENGYSADNIRINLVTEPYPTITEGILDQFNKGKYSMVVIGRRKKTKSEEFVMGDVSVKLVRALEAAAVMVVKSG
jgi:nucleotide-binding universal stress UspA family protein